MEKQLEFGFGALTGKVWITEPAERRVIVTPDESPVERTTYPEKSNSHAGDDSYLGVCRRCKKGDVYLICFKNGETDVRCTYCN